MPRRTDGDLDSQARETADHRAELAVILLDPLRPILPDKDTFRRWAMDARRDRMKARFCGWYAGGVVDEVIEGVRG